MNKTEGFSAGFPVEKSLDDAKAKVFFRIHYLINNNAHCGSKHFFYHDSPDKKYE